MTGTARRLDSARVTVDALGQAVAVVGQVPTWEQWELARLTLLVQREPLASEQWVSQADGGSYETGDYVLWDGKTWQCGYGPYGAQYTPGTYSYAWALVPEPENTPACTIYQGTVAGGRILGFSAEADKDDFAQPITIFPGDFLTVAWESATPGSTAVVQLFGTASRLTG